MKTLKICNLYAGIGANKNQRIGKNRSQTKTTIEDKEKQKGFNLSAYNGIDKKKVLTNAVMPEDGLYLLNCARNIITKSNVNQLDLYEKA